MGREKNANDKEQVFEMSRAQKRRKALLAESGVKNMKDYMEDKKKSFKGAKNSFKKGKMPAAVSQKKKQKAKQNKPLRKTGELNKFKDYTAFHLGKKKGKSSFKSKSRFMRK